MSVNADIKYEISGQKLLHFQNEIFSHREWSGRVSQRLTGVLRRITEAKTPEEVNGALSAMIAHVSIAITELEHLSELAGRHFGECSDETLFVPQKKRM